PWVHVDPAKLGQALRNLLSNAYKYSPGGGSVTLRLLRHGAGEVDIEVEDRGIGMNAEELERVTERFYRADRSGAIPGTGLGMAIVKEIVELM
uniref:sensor histidine kinase n=1 Tax=Klebsiella aerogenes TaxID=548 RepID=UPI0013D4F11B